MAVRNPCSKTVKPEQAYEVWQVENHPGYGGRWTWFVLKKYQSPDREVTNPFARWLCWVISPYVRERGEYGDTYKSSITQTGAKLVIQNHTAEFLQFHIHAEKPTADGKNDCVDLWIDQLSTVQSTYRDLCSRYRFVELLLAMPQEDEKEAEEKERVQVLLLTHGSRPALRVQDVQSSEMVEKEEQS